MYSITYGSDLKPPDDWPHKTWLALIHTGDNQGPPTPEDVKKLLQRARKELPGVRIRMGRLSDFGDAIRAENPDLPVVRADMPDTWIHGILSMPIETAIARRVRPAIAALEALDTLLSCWGVEHPATKPDIAAAYEGSFLYGEHTWGYDAKRFPRLYGEAWKAARAAGKYRRLEQSWADHGEYIRKAERLVKPKLTDCMEALARAVQVDGPRVVVFNPLPWARDDVVTIRVDSARLAQASLVDVATGQRVATERDGSTVRFVARDLPPLGYRTYAPAGQQSSATVRMEAASPSATLENRFFRIELDPDRGAIRSWIDKQTGRELVDAESEYGFGQYLYERFDADDASGFYEAYCRVKVPWARADFAKPELPPASEVPHLSASPENFRLTVRRGPVATTATMSAPPSDRVPHGVSITITLYDALPLLDLAWTVENKQADPWPEAGWLCFPLRIDEPSFRLARPGVVIDPARDIRRSANHEVFCLAGGVTISGADGFGAGLCPVESPLVSLGRPGLYRYSRQFGRRGPAVFVNLYNNTWGTNFQQWIGGTWTSRVRLWVTRTGQPEAVRTADLVTRSWQARSRSKAAWTDGPAGNLPPARTGLELSRRGTLVTSFGLNPDGDGIVLRLWEQTGRSGTCRIRLPSGLPVTRAQPCDLRGQWQGDPIPIRQGCFDLSLSAYAPSSVLLHSER
ncbi:MAG: hypothetical protein GXP27_01350 [Planctomycetes bacterium]|nr:hypothetical protein [Planctomycetota bacterium]